VRTFLNDLDGCSVDRQLLQLMALSLQLDGVRLQFGPELGQLLDPAVLARLQVLNQAIEILFETHSQLLEVASDQHLLLVRFTWHITAPCRLSIHMMVRKSNEI